MAKNKKKTSAEINQIVDGLMNVDNLRREYDVVAHAASVLGKVLDATSNDDSIIKKLGEEQYSHICRQRGLAMEYRDILAVRICLLEHDNKKD